MTVEATRGLFATPKVVTGSARATTVVPSAAGSETDEACR